MSLRATPLEQEVSAQALPLWRRYPFYGYLAIIVNLLAWYISWNRIDPLSPYMFFPLWFTFILIIDALNKARTGTSLMTRAPLKFMQLFGFSIVSWWLFETLNVPAQNWHYVTDHHYSTLAYIFIASLDFSTVLPAVLECAELWFSFKGLRSRLPARDQVTRISPALAVRLLLIGAVCLMLLFLLPNQAFILIWLSLIFLLDPINNLLGRKSALAHLQARDWRFFVALPLAGITCGVFWEMWNFYALPKWFYTIPY